MGLLQRHAAETFDFGFGSELAEGVHRRFDDIHRIGRAVTLAEDVGDADRFANRTDRSAGDNAGTGRSGKQHDARGAKRAAHAMRDRVVGTRHGLHAAASVLGRLFDARRDFVGFAVTPADFALAVTDDNASGERKTAPAFDHGRTTADRDHFVN